MECVWEVCVHSGMGGSVCVCAIGVSVCGACVSVCLRGGVCEMVCGSVMVCVWDGVCQCVCACDVCVSDCRFWAVASVCHSFPSHKRKGREERKGKA